MNDNYKHIIELNYNIHTPCVSMFCKYYELLYILYNILQINDKSQINEFQFSDYQASKIADNTTFITPVDKIIESTFIAKSNIDKSKNNDVIKTEKNENDHIAKYLGVSMSESIPVNINGGGEKYNYFLIDELNNNTDLCELINNLNQNNQCIYNKECIYNYSDSNIKNDESKITNDENIIINENIGDLEKQIIDNITKYEQKIHQSLKTKSPEYNECIIIANVDYGIYYYYLSLYYYTYITNIIDEPDEINTISNCLFNIIDLLFNSCHNIIKNEYESTYWDMNNTHFSYHFMNNIIIWCDLIIHKLIEKEDKNELKEFLSSLYNIINEEYDNNIFIDYLNNKSYVNLKNSIIQKTTSIESYDKITKLINLIIKYK